MRIILNNITKTFSGNNILSNVNIALYSGNIIGFVGRNGSGKSVLLKILCGFYKATSGSISIDNVILDTNSSFLPNTRVLIEKPSFIPDLTGFENLKVLAKIKNEIDDAKINEILDLVNLNKEERNKKYHKYSLGMKQKLGIAQVLMEDPKIMIFDEPFNGVEENTVKKIRAELLRLKKKDKIIVIATHIKEDINELVDVVYEFDDGIVSLKK